MTLDLECMYCGHKWEKTAYDRRSIESATCPKCKDSNLKVRDRDTSKVDYYKGSPPFPPKPIKLDTGFPWSMGGFEDPGSID